MLKIKYFDKHASAKVEDHGQAGNCGRCKEYKKLDLHHRVKRSAGGSDKYLIGLCRNCHSWVESHSKEAEKLGFHIPYYLTEEYKKKYEKTIETTV